MIAFDFPAWIVNGIPTDLPTPEHPIQDVTCLQRHLSRYLYFRQGHLDASHFRAIAKKESTTTTSADLLCDENDNDDDDDDTCPAIPKMMIRQVTVVLDHWRDGQEISKFAQCLRHCPNLQSIRIEAHGSCLYLILHSLLEGLGDSPNLHTMELNVKPVIVANGRETIHFRRVLGKLVELRRLEIHGIPSQLWNELCLGLVGHASLETLAIHSTEGMNANDFHSLLASLPNLKTLTCSILDPQHITLCRTDTLDTLATIFSFDAFENLSRCNIRVPRNVSQRLQDQLLRDIGRGRNLKELQLHNMQERDGDGPTLGETLSRLPLLQTLCIDRIRAQTLLHCPQLLHLESVRIDGSIREVMQFLPALESIRFYTCGEGFPEITSQGTLHSLEFNGGFNTEMSARLERTLMMNHSLRKLSLNSSPEVISVLANAIQQDTCVLQELSLRSIQSDISPLLYALQQNKSICSLAINATGDKDYWEHMVEPLNHVLPDLTHLTRLEIRLGQPHAQLCTLTKWVVTTLYRNLSLTRAAVDVPGGPSPEINFLCQLICRRNQIMKSIQTDTISSSLWPHILASSDMSMAYLFRDQICEDAGLM